MLKNSKETLITSLLLAICVVISLKLRILNPWESVFTYTTLLSENDPWYYYRLIENCIHNFPSRIWFDPMTQYPYGTYTHFGPFLVYLGAILGILFNATYGEALRNVLVFIPAIGGILTIFATFFLARKAFGNRVAIISAFIIAIIPGQFLHRSMLSFNDHHVWEVFWMVLTLAFFLCLANESWNRRGILLAILGGVSFGMYILTWAAGFTFGLLIIASLLLAAIIKIDIRKDTFKLTTLFFLTSTIIYAPFSFNAPSSPALYSPMQLSMLIFYTVSTIILWQFVDKYDRIYEKTFLKSLKLSKEISILILAALGIFAATLIFPELPATISTVSGYLSPKGGALTIGEVYPFFFDKNWEFTLAPAYYHFGTTFFLAVPGIAYIFYRLLRSRDLKDLTMLLWAIALFIALWGQNRFAYYFAAVAAVYSGLALNLLFEKLHLYKAFERLKGEKEKFSKVRVVFAVLIIFTLYPTYSLAENQSAAAGVINKQWYDAMVWLRENTPEDGYEEYYLQLYKPSENLSQPYSYPFKTYGVISWWDYGHWILAIGKRMAVANPFQQGIGNLYNNVPGASSFFVAQNESYAEWVAEKLNVRYVVSDIEMATGKFYAMATWAEGDLPLASKYYDGYMYVTENRIGIANYAWEIPQNSFIIPMQLPGELYYNTMEAKLHILDGSGLSHYRMIYESEPSYEWKIYSTYLDKTDPLSIAINDAYMRYYYGASPSLSAQEIIIRTVYNLLYKDTPVKLEASGYVKIFERVAGVKIKGKANSDFVEFNATIMTNQNRTFEYYKKVNVTNGEFEFIFPYAHDTKYPTKPLTPLYVKAGEKVLELYITEEQVLEGKEIEIDLG
ncbi:MAG: oligosaccharyl transferase, archaeosortase A system-associated [Archaeoglobaceae archaeon]